MGAGAQITRHLKCAHSFRLSLLLFAQYMLGVMCCLLPNQWWISICHFFLASCSGMMHDPTGIASDVYYSLCGWWLHVALLGWGQLRRQVTCSPGSHFPVSHIWISSFSVSALPQNSYNCLRSRLYTRLCSTMYSWIQSMIFQKELDMILPDLIAQFPSDKTVFVMGSFQACGKKVLLSLMNFPPINTLKNKSMLLIKQLP